MSLPSLVLLQLVEVTERSLWRQQPWLDSTGGGGGICVCVKASHLLEDMGVNSPPTCCPSWIGLPSLSIHPASHVSLLSLSVSLHPSILHSLTHSLSPSWGQKIPTPLLLNTHGASVKLHLCILVTGSVRMLVCMSFGELKKMQTLRALAPSA